MGACISIVIGIAQQLQEPPNNTSATPAAPTHGTNVTPAAPAAPTVVTNNVSPTPIAPVHVSPNPMVPNNGTQAVSPIYKSLPPDAEQFRVRNVYDGDTLTLMDERRVRLLGIDCPEVKEKQAFSQEAKEYTKQRCHQKDIWIAFQANSEKTDHYGRLLAFVYVEENNGYLCVNEGIVGEGLASVYKPNSDAKVSNWDKLLALQSQARDSKKGQWSTFEDYTVVKTSNGSAYHKRGCEHVATSRLTELKASEAAKLGLHPCRTCLADA
jgi:micrococcal nuclease